MTVHYFGDGNSLLNQFIAEIRDIEIQKDAMRFRRNIERIGEVLGYEMSKALSYRQQNHPDPFRYQGNVLAHRCAWCCVRY